jgi:hypothetical protein
VRAFIDSIMRSPSEGPPKSAERAAGVREDLGGGADGSVLEVEEFSTDHFRRVERFGSAMLAMFGKVRWFLRFSGVWRGTLFLVEG